MSYRLLIGLLFCIFIAWPGSAWGQEPRADEWARAMRALRGSPRDGSQSWQQFGERFPVQMDWMLQDAGAEAGAWLDSAGNTGIERKIIIKVLDEIGVAGDALRREFGALVQADVSGGDIRWLSLYEKACRVRREIRLRVVAEKSPKIVFTKHHNMGGSHYAYTEAQSDAQAERTFVPGTALCLLELSGGETKVRTLIEDANGVIRDPEVSFDGKFILFAWKKDDRKDDYHLYEMEVATGKIRQITEGLGYADYEGKYLPDGNIIFSSTRCVQTVDCFTTEVSNLYACDREGRKLRRLGFDQVHTNFPAVLDDGRVVYTRWEYNDRGQVFVQGLMQMNPDGTGQTEFYGMNSWFPTTIMHARGIPGSSKMIAVASGHHSRQTGKLILIDNAKGQQENSGVQLVAPVRETKAVHVDAYGQDGELWQYPYPLSETQYIVTYSPYGYSGGKGTVAKKGGVTPPLMGIYFMDIDGRRELLASDGKVSCNQPVPLAARPRPDVRPNLVDYRKTTATFYMQDVYTGQGLAGIARGTVKKLRVIALDYRLALIGSNNNGGPAGGAMIATPIAIGNGAWDVKIILGDATVRDDGSAFFEVPARTPVYFQAIDEKGQMVQSMRSWTTLQPGENAACVGCHETKNTAPLSRRNTYAQLSGVEKLKPFYGPARGFSFPKEIQPILDRHCVSCHDDRQPLPATTRIFNLMGKESVDQKARRKWSDAYLTLTAAKLDPTGKEAARGDPEGLWVSWIHAQSTPPVQPPYSAGAAKSKLMTLLEKNHQNIKLNREELEKIACWIDLAIPYCGDYTESNAWSAKEWEHHQRLLDKRKTQEALERNGIEQLYLPVRERR